MKTLTVIMASMAVAVAMGSSSVLAQNGAAPVRPTTPRAGNLDAAALDSKTMGSVVRASQLIGRNLQNSAGESVGEINDLVLDAKTGRITYAAVTYGGFLGMGNKMFAVPFGAFKVRQNPDDPGDAGDYVMVLDVTQAQLKGAVGFDQDHWPNMADQNFVRDLNKRYGVDVNVRPGGIDVDVNRN